ncbi:MAG: bifunctional ornithine acetyltransferase/N-acetylglutamate synthase, partial [Gammaproteobacteria bacterium]|nr:bifunctional ornithine acetyltransferase/N-acetylglutamate synthase [Gammaproteobacteria bacterium]
WLDAATGIMTTDTLPKAVSHKVTIDGRTISITGIAKGSGMIRPDMATMLAFVATDAVVEQAILQEYLSRAVERSFNAITIDGDTSTNDACTLVASGESGVNVSADNDVFQQAIDIIFVQLAQSIIRDAEGATKFVEIRVTGAETRVNAKEVAYTVAHSPLVKTALFASDP